VLAFDAPKPRDLPAWVRSQFGRLGANADPDAARALVEIVGDDLVALATEVDKITIWSGGSPITRADVEGLATPAREAAAWAITDAWASATAPRCCSGRPSSNAASPSRSPCSSRRMSPGPKRQAARCRGRRRQDIAKRVKVMSSRAQGDQPRRPLLPGRARRGTTRLASLDAALRARPAL
jgi:hypothetical protein